MCRYSVFATEEPVIDFASTVLLGASLEMPSDYAAMIGRWVRGGPLPGSEIELHSAVMVPRLQDVRPVETGLRWRNRTGHGVRSRGGEERSSRTNGRPPKGERAINLAERASAYPERTSSRESWTSYSGVLGLAHSGSRGRGASTSIRLKVPRQLNAKVFRFIP